MTEGWMKWSARIVTISFTTSLCFTSLGSSALADPPQASTPIEHLDCGCRGESHVRQHICHLPAQAGRNN